MLPPLAVQAWARAQLGADVLFEENTRRLAEARTWGVHRDGERLGWLKWHRRVENATNEQRAYGHWLVGLRDVSPEFLGACPERPAWLLTRHVAGEQLDGMALTMAERRAAYRNLGRVVARLHAADPSVRKDPAPLSGALHERAAVWIRRATEAGGFVGLGVVERLLLAPWPAEVRRVSCHRDVQLHNVIARREAGRLVTVLIDFGQARADYWLVDLVKLFQLPSTLIPGALDAFLEGYGRVLTGPERVLLHRLRLLHGVGIWTGAVTRGEPGVARGARTVIADAVRALS